MAHINWCGKRECGNCGHDCALEVHFPCFPSCNGLEGDSINIITCLKAGCLDNLAHMFFGEYDESGKKDNEYIEKLKDMCDEDGLIEYPYTAYDNWYEARDNVYVNTAISIIDLFEDFLEDKGIWIENDEREGEEGEACIFGSDYYGLEDAIVEILKNMKF